MRAAEAFGILTIGVTAIRAVLVRSRTRPFRSLDVLIQTGDFRTEYGALSALHDATALWVHEYGRTIIHVPDTLAQMPHFDTREMPQVVCDHAVFEYGMTALLQQ